MLIFKVKMAMLRQQLYTLFHYYPQNPRFAILDTLLGIIALILNPYRICRRRDLGPYGETPISTLHQIAHLAHLTPQDHWFDLGSGRGKTCFWISLFYGCPSTGIDAIPLFTRIARALARLLRTPTTFLCQDLHAADLSCATCLYLYSTCMSDAALLSLFPKIPSGARILTISAPFPGLIPTASIPVSFPWGDTEAFLHVK